MVNLQKTLETYGLSSNEAKVYVASLRLGTSKVQAIAEKADLLRTTTYEILRTLVTKGIMSYVIRSGTKYFEAAEPKLLLRTLEEKKEQLKTIMPELEALKVSAIKKPSVEFYEGIEGIKTILEQIIKEKPAEVLQLGSANIFETLEYYFPHWITRRTKAGIKTRVLQEKDKKIQKIRKDDKKEKRKIRYLPKTFNIQTHTQIYDDKVAMITLQKKELIGIMIRNKAMTETQRSQFEYIWKQAR